MDQRTHAWIAIRAIGLLEEEGTNKELVRLLRPHAKHASVGAWIPDMTDARRGGSKVQNHVFKMEEYSGADSPRFVTSKEKLLGLIGEGRAFHDVISDDTDLDQAWWEGAYKADPPPGLHLPNRGMALGTMVQDLLLMGNSTIDKLLPGSVSFMSDVAKSVRTLPAAAATYLFMLSHFVADACMPCHADARLLAGYSAGLHEQWERYWSTKKVGSDFDKRKLLSSPKGTDVLKLAARRGEDNGVKFAPKPTIPALGPKLDVWLDLVYVCRASFVLMSIVAHPKKHPYSEKIPKKPFKPAKFDEVFKGREQLFDRLNAAILHDSVLNTAIAWKHVWQGASA